MHNSVPHCECWFLDIGQGSSSVILLGKRRAIVIDAGPRGCTVPIQLLNRHVDTIEALIITHNDDDHDGGVARILAAYPTAVRKLYFLEDRPAAVLKTFRTAQLERANGRLSCEPERLEAKDEPQVVYADANTGIELRLLYPTFLENLAAQEDTIRHNRTSGILVLMCGTRKILFSGDATIQAWESLSLRMKSYLPLRCDVMTAPHHGGLLAASRKGTGSGNHHDHKANVQRLYSEITNADYVVISVGSSNQHQHPDPSTVDLLCRLGKSVICTQLTPHCCDNLELLRPGIVDPIWPSQSTKSVRLTGAGRSKDVACAGSIVADVGLDHVTLSIWPSHQRRVGELTSSGDLHPMCRV